MTQTQPTQTTHSTDHYLALFQQRADRFTRVVEAVTGDWDVPSPCEGWSARDVVGHVVDTQRAFLEQHGLHGQDLDAGPEPERAHLTSVLADSAVAATAYDGYFGPTTVAATVADFYGWDLVVHGSDVARATGQEWSVTEEEAAALHATADGWGDALHSDGVCGAPVEVGSDASATDRLLARLGRDPRWEPSLS